MALSVPGTRILSPPVPSSNDRLHAVLNFNLATRSRAANSSPPCQRAVSIRASAELTMGLTARSSPKNAALSTDRGRPARHFSVRREVLRPADAGTLAADVPDALCRTDTVIQTMTPSGG